ncbi:hypothetical protein D3C87_1569290 [compost metagenome]
MRLIRTLFTEHQYLAGRRVGVAEAVDQCSFVAVMAQLQSGLSSPARQVFQSVQRQSVGIKVVLGGRQLKSFVGACHPHLQPCLLAQFRESRGNLAVFQLLKFQFIRRARNGLRDAGWQARFGVDQGLYLRACAALEFSVALLEQAFSLALSQLRQRAAQVVGTVFEAWRGQAERLAHQRLCFGF